MMSSLLTSHRTNPGRATYSHVDAWDPDVLLASMLATAGDLVFTGNPEGERL
jgi:hypothetical protein